MLVSQISVVHVVNTNHEFNIFAKLDHVLNCRIYPLIPAQVSIDQDRNKSTVHVYNVCQLVGESNCGVVGDMVSKIIVSVVFTILPLVFHRVSIKLIYTVFSQSHALNVRDFVVAHHVQFVGDDEFQYATCTVHTHESVGHVMFNVTHVLVVHIAEPLIVKLHHTGQFVSILSVLPVVEDAVIRSSTYHVYL